MQRQGAKNHHEKGRTPAETKVREASGRKSPQKRPIWRRLGKGRFAETGWWRQSGTNWRPTTQSSNRSPPPSRERKFAMQRRARKSRLITQQRSVQRRAGSTKAPIPAQRLVSSRMKLRTRPGERRVTAFDAPK